MPIRDGGRANAIAWMADGSIVPTDTIVRFDVAEGEKPPRRLADAFHQTNAGASTAQRLRSGARRPSPTR